MAPSPPRLRVDVASGATHLSAVDLILPGPIPLALTRHYTSSSRLATASLGPDWRFGLDIELEIGADRIACHGGPFDGTAFAPVAVGRAAVQEATGLTIEHVRDAYVLSASPRRQLVFLTRHAIGDRIPLAAIRDGSGQTVQIERRGGRIVEVRDPVGRSLQFSVRGDAVEAIDLVVPGAQPVAVARYGYAGGHLRSAAGPDGRAEQFDTDGGYLTAHRSRAGVQTYAQYAEDGRCLALWRDGGEAVHLAYDDLRQATRVLDASGGQTIYRHVAGKQILERIDAGGASHNYYYDEANRLIGHGNAAGVRAFQRLDPAEHRLAHLDREERVAFVQYHANGLATSAEDAFDNLYGLHRSETHALVGVTDPEGETWTFERDDAGRVTAVASPEGRRGRLVWDRNRLTAEDAEGTRWRETTDALGRVVSRVDRSRRRATRRYGADGHLAEVRLDDYAVEILFDAEGRFAGTADSESRRVRIDRDATGRIVSETAPSGQAVRLQRDALGRITAATDGQGDPLQLAYDADGRLAALAGRIEATYTYDGGDTTVRDATGARRYSFAGDLVEWMRGEDETQTFQTGPSGNLLSWEHTRDGRTHGSLYPEFDASGRLRALSGQRQLDGEDVDIEARLVYDRDGALAEIHDATGIAVGLQLDIFGRPVELAGYDVMVRLTYDDADRLRSAETDGDVIELAYDSLDRVVAVRRGETTTDLRADELVVVSETLAHRTPHAPPEPDPKERWARTPTEPVISSLSVYAERRGVAVLAHLGAVAVPLWVGTERRCPHVSATAQRLACAIRGPAAIFPPVAEGETLVDLWSPGARSLQLDHTAVPRARDLGLPGDLLDAFFLDPAHLDSVPVGTLAQPHHQLDGARDPNDALTGPHRRGPLRPAPWRERAARPLFPIPDLLAPDGAPAARTVIDFLRRRG